MSSRLLHKGTGYYFRFGNFICMYAPGKRRRAEDEDNGANWNSTLTILREWAQRVKAESDAPDLWATIGDGMGFIEQSSPPDDNSPFTKEEQLLIAARLDDLKAHLMEQDNFQEDQRSYIESQFAYLKESSLRVGRKDWRLITYSVLIGLVINLAIPPQTAQGLMHLAQSLLQWIWAAGQHLLTQPPPI